jgi:hypothetical protein
MVMGSGENPVAGHLSRMAISRLLAGEGAPPLGRDMAAHLEGCAECREAVATARADSDPIARKFPTFESLDTVMRRRKALDASQKAPGSPSLLSAMLQNLDGFFRGTNGRMLGTGFATLLVLGLGTWVWMAGQTGFDPDRTAKGSETPAEGGFFLYLNGSQAYGDTLRAAPGDTLQLGIVSPRPVHYAVLYRDDDKALGVYMGGSENGIVPLGNPQGEPLPKSLILEGGWKREILYCLWADRPFTIPEAKLRIDSPASRAGDLRLRAIILGNHKP